MKLNRLQFDCLFSEASRLCNKQEKLMHYFDHLMIMTDIDDMTGHEELIKTVQEHRFDKDKSYDN